MNKVRLMSHKNNDLPFLSILSLRLNESLQQEIKQELSSVQKITCITTMADKRIISVFWPSGGYCAPHLCLLLKLNSFLNLSLFSRGIYNGR